jgi:hypothetical protein
MDLNVKSAQDFSNKFVHRQVETGGEERLEHNQLAFRFGDFLRPRDTSDSAAKVLSVSSDDASAGGVAAAEEEEVSIATYRRRRRAVCFTRARSPANKSKEGRRAARRWKRRLGFSRSAESEVQNAPPPAPFYT